MKKFLSVLLIVLAVLGAGVIACMILTMYQNQAFGEFMLTQYSDITSDYSCTVEAFYAKLVPILAVSACVIFVLALVSGIGLHFCKDEAEGEATNGGTGAEEPVKKERKPLKVKFKIGNKEQPEEESYLKIEKDADNRELNVNLNAQEIKSTTEEFLAKLRARKG